MNPYLFTNKINLKTLTFGSNNGEYYKEFCKNLLINSTFIRGHEHQVQIFRS